MVQGGRKGCRTNISHVPNLHIFTAEKLILAPINLEHLHVWDHNNILPMYLQWPRASRRASKWVSCWYMGLNREFSILLNHIYENSKARPETPPLHNLD